MRIESWVFRFVSVVIFTVIGRHYVIRVISLHQSATSNNADDEDKPRIPPVGEKDPLIIGCASSTAILILVLVIVKCIGRRRRRNDRNRRAKSENVSANNHGPFKHHNSSSSLAVIREGVEQFGDEDNGNEIDEREIGGFAAVNRRQYRRRPSARRVWDSESSDDNAVPYYQIRLDQMRFRKKQQQEQRLKRWDDVMASRRMEMEMVEGDSDASVKIRKERVGVAEDVNEVGDAMPLEGV